jgi:hypothetical protein
MEVRVKKLFALIEYLPVLKIKPERSFSTSDSATSDIATCQNSGTLQLHEHECVMHDTLNILNPKTSNRENHL